MKTVTIKRLIPAGGINPNTGTPYDNLEEKLKECFEPGYPIPIYDIDECRNNLDSFSPDISKAVGFATAFTDDSFNVNLTKFGELYEEYGDELRIGCCLMVDTPTQTDPIKVHNIPYLTIHIHPNLLIDIANDYIKIKEEYKKSLKEST